MYKYRNITPSWDLLCVCVCEIGPCGSQKENITIDKVNLNKYKKVLYLIPCP